MLLLAVVDGAPGAAGARRGPWVATTGRHRPPPGPPPEATSEEVAQGLLANAAERWAGGHGAGGRERVVRHGRGEHEVVDAATGADLLVLARDGRPGTGPHTVGPRARFVVDHAPCPVLLAAPEGGRGLP